MSVLPGSNRSGRTASAALEFALVLPVLFALIFGATELGLIWWTKNSLQLTAALAARCIALNSCSDPVSFVTSNLRLWEVPGSVSASDVTYTTHGACNNDTKLFAKITIVYSFWGAGMLPPPFSSVPLSVSACYPMQ